MQLSALIKKYRADHRLSIRKFADKCGVSNVTILYIERGENPQTKQPIIPTLPVLKSIAEGMDMSLDDLLRLADDMRVILTDEPNVEFRTVKVHPIPVFESASAGFGAYADDNIVDYEYLPFTNDSEAFETLCIRVSGDSMLPKIEDGDLVQVRRQTSVDSGDLAVVLVDGTEGYIKVVEYNTDTPDPFIRLVSYNPYYPPIEFKDAAVQRVSVVGKVMKIIREV